MNQGTTIKFLLKNQENLVTAFDIHKTLSDLLNAKNIEDITRPIDVPNGKSYNLFNEIIPNCKNNF